MPDRILRANILTSDPVNSLSWAGEVFYRRLMSIVDDFGRFDARVSILRANLYPLQLDKVSEADLIKWKGECSKAGLVSFYEVDGKEYLELLKFGQRLRAMKSKYPPSPESADKCGQMPANDSGQQQKRDGDGIGCGKESETEEPPTSFADELKRDQLYFEQLAISWRIDKEAFLKMIAQFGLSLSTQGKSHPSYPEFKSHFFNWASKKYTQFLKPKKQMVD